MDAHYARLAAMQKSVSHQITKLGRLCRRAFAAIPMTRQSRLKFKRLLFRGAGPLLRGTRAYRNWLYEGGDPTSLVRPALLNASAPPRRSESPSLFKRTCGPDSALPELDISIVTHNSARWLEGFFESLLAQDYPIEKIGLFVADNASADETMAKIQALLDGVGERFRTVRLSSRRNDGFGGGHNHNAAQAAAPLFLIANVDLKFDAKSLVTAASFAQRDGDDVAAWELRQKPYEHPKYYDPISLETAWCSAACLLVRLDIFKDVGGFDDRIFMYGEDVELSYRLRDRGYRLRYLPRAVVWHYTYEHEGEVKPLQFEGTILANGYLRLRYGTLWDMTQLPLQFARSFLARGPVPDHRKLVARQAGRLLLNAPHFLLRRKRSTTRFGFCGWDYELRRGGDFHALSEGKGGDTPRVSVVVRTYQGRSALLAEAVASVVNQTYENIELLVVEDGTDDAGEVVSSIGRETGLTTRHIAAPKRGRSHAGNLGLAAATGDYIMFLDDDDLLFADHIETVIDALQTSPDHLAAYALSWQVETEYVGECKKIEYLYSIPQSHRQKYSREALNVSNFIPIQSMIFHRSLFETFGGFIEHLHAFEDWNLWLRYSQRTDFKFIEKITSLYRVPADEKARLNRGEQMQAFDLAARSAGLGEDAQTRSPQRTA